MRYMHIIVIDSSFYHNTYIVYYQYSSSVVYSCFAGLLRSFHIGDHIPDNLFCVLLFVATILSVSHPDLRKY